jgi:hypothetical protein
MTYEDFKKKQQARAQPRARRGGAQLRTRALSVCVCVRWRSCAPRSCAQADAKAAMEVAAQEEVATRASALRRALHCTGMADAPLLFAQSSSERSLRRTARSAWAAAARRRVPRSCTGALGCLSFALLTSCDRRLRPSVQDKSKKRKREKGDKKEKKEKKSKKKHKKEKREKGDKGDKGERKEKKEKKRRKSDCSSSSASSSSSSESAEKFRLSNWRADSSD